MSNYCFDSGTINQFNNDNFVTRWANRYEKFDNAAKNSIKSVKIECGYYSENESYGGQNNIHTITTNVFSLCPEEANDAQPVGGDGYYINWYSFGLGSTLEYYSGDYTIVKTRNKRRQSPNESSDSSWRYQYTRDCGGEWYVSDGESEGGGSWSRRGVPLISTDGSMCFRQSNTVAYDHIAVILYNTAMVDKNFYVV